MRTIFSNRSISLWLAGWGLMLSCGLFAQKPRIVGDAAANSFSVVKVYGTDIYAIGSRGGSPTFTRFAPNGKELWTVLINQQATMNDFIQTVSGDFLLVGQTEPSNQDNRCITAHVLSTGSILYVTSYNLSGQEGFKRIIQAPNSSDPGYQYLVLGTRAQTPAGNQTQDYTVLAACDSYGYIAGITRVLSGSQDYELNKALKRLSNGAIAFCGAVSGSGRITRLDSQLTPFGTTAGGWFPNNVPVESINDFVEKADNSGTSTLIWVGKTTAGESIIARNTTASGATRWAYIGSSNTNFLQILEAGGHYYLVVEVTVGTAKGYGIARVTENSAGTAISLDWIKSIDSGQNAYTPPVLGNGIAVNSLVYADGRSDGLPSLGQMDGFIAFTNLELSTCYTQTGAGFVLSPITLSTTLIPPTTQANGTPFPQFSTGTTINYNEYTLCSIFKDTIIPNNPVGLLEYEPGDGINFDWEGPDGYGSTYRLKIMQLAPGDTVPTTLPDAGLFFNENGIAGTDYDFQGQSLDTAFRYAWQVETDVPFGGGIVRGGPVVISPIISKGFLAITSVLPSQSCQCFDVSGNLFPSTTSTANHLKRISFFFSNTSGIQSVTMQPSGASVPFSTGPPAAGPLAPGFATWGNTFTARICMKPTATGPITVWFYATRLGFPPNLPCINNQIGATCSRTVVSHTFNLVKPFIGTPAFSILHPTTGQPQTQICDGDPVKFNMPIPLAPNVNIVWEADAGSGWGPVSAVHSNFPNAGQQTVFQIPAGVLKANCATAAGFSSIKYRAKITVTGPNNTVCTYYSVETPLKICCKPSPISITILNNLTGLPQGPLCEGEPYDIKVILNSPDPFVPSGQFVNVVWTQANAGCTIPAGQTMFICSGIAGQSDISFSAIVSNCACPPVSATACISVQKKTVCGTIQGNWPTMQPSLDPPQNPAANLSYIVCEGDDAALQIVQPFANCNPQWEWALDPVNGPWTSLGFTNSTQYTNILPPQGWAVGGCVYYRINCKPIPLTATCQPGQSTSACPDCTSNIVEICFVPRPDKPIVVAGNYVCKGQGLWLYVGTNFPSETYCWFWNGQQIGFGSPIYVPNAQPGNYWVWAINSCGQIVESDWLDLTVCCPEAGASCPLDEFGNPICPKPNQTFCMWASPPQFSTANCSPIMFYTWWVDGVLQPPQTPPDKLTLSLPAGPHTIELEITDAQGCTHKVKYKLDICP